MDFPYCKNHKLPHCNDFSESFPHSFQPFQHPKCVTHPRIPSFFQSQSKESSGQSVVDRLILKKHEIILLKTEFLGIFFPIKLMSLSQIHRKTNVIWANGNNNSQPTLVCPFGRKLPWSLIQPPCFHSCVPGGGLVTPISSESWNRNCTVRCQQWWWLVNKCGLIVRTSFIRVC